MSKLTYRGDAELRRQLGRLRAEVAGAALVAAGTAGMLIVQNEAKRLVPKVTRTLSRSIHTETVESSPTRAVIKTGTDVEYAMRIEYGFEGLDSLLRRYHQAPQPYLRPAMDENTDRVMGEVATVLRLVIERAAR